MKKCTYCGKNYPDDVARCLIDNELLSGGEPQALTGVEEISDPVAPPPLTLAPLPATTWTERQFCIFEILLVCTIAFGSSILASGHFLLFGNLGQSGSGSTGAYTWLYRCVFEASALGLLWYVLIRRKKTFSSLGLAWEWKDIGRSIVLMVIGCAAYYTVYAGLSYTGLAAVAHKTSSDQVAGRLFGGGVSLATFLFLFLNPFFEELIVRAYLITEIKLLSNSTVKAIVVSTVLQTSYHFYQGVPLAFSYSVTFLIYSIYYAKTNRIAPIILAHLYCDVGSTLLYMFRS